MALILMFHSSIKQGFTLQYGAKTTFIPNSCDSKS